MLYRYDTHVHSSQCSACSMSTSQELVRTYHRAGYAGIVLTDHFIYGNTAVERSLPWEEQMNCYYNAYLEAKEEADKLDFDVIFGLEHAYGSGKEMLLYGIDLDFLLANPDIPRISIDELVGRVHEYGGLAVQAHPYRDRWYTDISVPPRFDLIDGIEVYNAGNQLAENIEALKVSQNSDYIITCGGDVHSEDSFALGVAGIVLPRRVKNGREFVAALREKKHQYIVNGTVVSEITEQQLKAPWKLG